MKKSKLFIVVAIIILLAFSMIACDPDGTGYTISFDTTGGSNIEDIVIDKDTENFDMPQDPEKEGYLFEGWYLDSDFETEATPENILASLDEDSTSITLYANWTEAEPTGYTISFDVDGGSEVADIEIDSETDDFEMPSDPEKDFWVFDGWYMSTDFDTEATQSNILSALDEENTEVTVYAKWMEIPSSQSESMLQDAFEFMYEETSGKNMPAEPTSEDQTELDALEDDIIDFGFDLSAEDNVFDKYDTLFSNFLIDYYEYANGSYYLEMWDEIYNHEEDYDTHSEQIERIEREYGFNIEYRDSIETIIYNFEENYTWTNEQIEKIEEYKDLLEKFVDYENYLNELESFNNLMSDVIDDIGDIRSPKLAKMASYLNSYDYDSFMEEIDRDGYISYEPDITRLPSFFVDMIRDSEFTTDDVGRFLYAFINSFIDQTGDEEFLQEVQGALSLELITDFSELVLGYVSIIEDMNLLSTVRNIVEDEENEGDPTIAEMATLISAMKTSLDSYLADYTQEEIDDAFNAVIGVLSTLSATEYAEGEYIQMIMSMPLFPTDEGGVYTTIEDFSSILDIFDTDALNVFLVEIDDEGKNIVIPKMMDPTISEQDEDRFMANIAILEAKLINILTDGDALKYEEAYGKLLDTLEIVFPNHLIEQNDGPVDMGIIINEVFDAIRDKLRDHSYDTIDITSIQTLAEEPFITEGEPTINENSPEIQELLLMKTLANTMPYEQLISQVYSFYGINEDSGEGEDEGGISSFQLGFVLYLLDIDSAKLQDFVDDLTDSETGLPLDNYIIGEGDEAQFDSVSFVLDIIPMIKEAELDTEISDLLVWALEYGANIGSELISPNGFDTLRDDITIRENLVYLILNIALNADTMDPFTAIRDAYSEDSIAQDELSDVMDVVLTIAEEVAMTIEENPLTDDEVTTAFAIVREVLGDEAYDFEATITLMENLEELIFEMMSIEMDEEAFPAEIFVFLSKVSVEIFGVDFGPEVTIEDRWANVNTILDNANDEDRIAGILEVIFDNYTDVIYIAQKDINNIPPETDDPEQEDYELWQKIHNLANQLMPFFPEEESGDQSDK